MDRANINSSKLPVRFDDVSRRPIEWPTFLLALFTYCLFALSTVAYIFLPILTAPLWILLNAIAVYLGFTVIHEASHKNIIRSNVRMNHLLGYLSGIIMHGSFYQFVLIHHQHHAHTNHPEKDPDYGAAGKMSISLILKIGLFLFHYIEFFWKKNLDHLRTNPVATYFPYVIVMGIYASSIVFGFLEHVLIIWTLPVFLGTVCVMIVFDYIPHTPHNRQGRYDNSRNYVGNPVWSWLSQMHAYHIVHHLSPSIAWYRYEEVYWKKRKSLLEAGALETKVDWKTLALTAQERAQEKFDSLRSRFGT